MLRWGKFEITGGFLLLAAILYYLDDQDVLLWAALACGLHELGHYGAIWVLGGKVARIRLTAVGAEMTLSAAWPMGHLAQCLAALAGPGVNLVLAVFAARLALRYGEDLYLFAGLNLGLAVFNLLPANQLDGGRALYHLISLFWQPGAETISRLLSVMTVAVLLTAGLYLFWNTKTNVTLLITSLWLVASLSPFNAKKPACTHLCRKHRK